MLTWAFSQFSNYLVQDFSLSLESKKTTCKFAFLLVEFLTHSTEPTLKTMMQTNSREAQPLLFWVADFLNLVNNLMATGECDLVSGLGAELGKLCLFAFELKLEQRDYKRVLACAGQLCQNDKICTELVEKGLLKGISKGLSMKSEVKEVALYALSNVPQSSPECLDAVLEADFLPRLLQLLKSGVINVEVEAAYALTNLLKATSSDQLVTILENYQVEESLVSQIKNPKASTSVKLMLQAWQLIFKLKDDIIMKRFECSGGLTALEALQEYGNEEVARMAQELLVQNFEIEKTEQISID